jgi:hypothetical protein
MLALGPELWQAFAGFEWPADDVVPAPPPGNGASRQERMVADLRSSATQLRRTADDLEKTAGELEQV